MKILLIPYRIIFFTAITSFTVQAPCHFVIGIINTESKIILLEPNLQVRSLNSKLPVDERETATIVIDHAGPPPDAFQHFIEINPVAATLAMHYTLQVRDCFS